jgi:hypothetical protein
MVGWHKSAARLALGGTLAVFLGFTALAARGTVGTGAAGDRIGAPQAAPVPAKPPKAKKEALARLAEPWPAEEELAARREEAEKLSLFESDAPLSITLKADFSEINKDRTPDSTKTFPGVLEVPAEGGRLASIPIELSTRGNARLNRRTCSMVPLRVEFAKKDLEPMNGTPFWGQRELKLVTHCETLPESEQNVLTEYLVYRIFRIFTPRSYRARLVKAVYHDTDKDRPGGPRYGFFIERDADVARRMEGRLYPLEKRLFRVLDQESLTLMALLQYMVGNTDYSIYALHNVRLVQDRKGVVFPVTYDFDYSGLVNAHYAVADKRFNIESVRDRLYRGPCRTMEELEPFLATFRAKKADVLAAIETIPDLKQGRRNDAKKYLDEFFSMAENPRRAKRELVDGCKSGAGM